MDDAALLRYGRQIMLPQLDIAGQERLLAARVLIVGLGGLGSPVALYLAAAGVGHLDVADGDRVDASNLQRQLLHGEADLGRPKAASARDRIAALDPRITVTAREARLAGAALSEAVAAADVVVDATDDLGARYAMNEACLAHGIPLVSAAAIRFEAQLSTFDPRRDDSPCYRCLWPDATALAEACAENGVIAPLVGIAGSLQALEVVRLLTGIGTTLVGRVLVYDGLDGRFDEFRLARRANCPACGDR
ncbi:MAG: molybdopterin-synthase adenylyltransferase MoeB [Pseudomonadales bacterium]|jgi:adenylyltransferase/sulfurtransferase|nr:molybdopterin-synthase adenylyltransferase MoeB [Pseudomonadales bacterium]